MAGVAADVLPVVSPICPLPPLRRIHPPPLLAARGDWQIPTSQEQYLVHWKPSSIKNGTSNTI